VRAEEVASVQADVTLEEFEVEAAAFLQANAKPKVEARFEWGVGSDRVALFADKSPEEDRAELAAARQWAEQVYDAGFGWVSGPPDYGGRGLGREFARAWQTLQAGYDTPPLGVFSVGLGMVAPTVLAHGTDEQKAHYLPALYRGDLVGCQLFSERGAGSDLASLTTRAVRDGDEWVVNGQKVWTSYAHLADVGEIICRTDPDLEKHQGLTAFLIDMHQPGVEVRPLRQMTGGASFNEVFFTDAHIPDRLRLGGVSEGWGVALTTLMNERAAIGATGGGGGGTSTTRLIELVRHLGKDQDPLVRQRLAEVIINSKVAGYTNLRAMARIAAGGVPGPEMSISKLALTANMVRICELASTVLGPELVANSGRWGTYAWTELLLGVPAMRIAGGSDEVLRNILGERVLGLPKEPKPAGATG